MSEGHSTAAPVADARFPFPARVVVKLGSAVLVAPTAGGLKREILGHVAADIAELRARGTSVVVVTSGAVAMGMSEIGLAERPGDITTRQALAAIGQSAVMQAWRDALSWQGMCAAQVLLTHDDLRHRRRYLNARHAITRMLELGAVPVVNENDTVAIDELKLGDNDTLSAQVAAALDADLLVLLSGHDGLFDADPASHPQARRIPFVAEVDGAVEALSAHGISAVGSGGMATKVQAAKAAAQAGIATVVAAGSRKGVLLAAASGADVGTHFASSAHALPVRKRWLGLSAQPAGALRVDAGAARALVADHRSLLPGGVVGVDGAFRKGDVVVIAGPDGQPLARGLVAYDADEVRRLAGHRSSAIEAILGYRFSDEIVHRDDLVVLREGAAAGDAGG